MGKTVVRAEETAQALALRVGRPLCMLLRANRLFSAAWLLPGREIEVPEGDFCQADGFPCPAAVMRAPLPRRRLYLRREGETREAAARALGVPLRMIPLYERAFGVPEAEKDWQLRPAGLHTALDEEERAVNGLFGVVYPGTELLRKKQ